MHALVLLDKMIRHFKTGFVFVLNVRVKEIIPVGILAVCILQLIVYIFVKSSSRITVLKQKQS